VGGSAGRSVGDEYAEEYKPATGDHLTTAMSVIFTGYKDTEV
jgi:hypothetical protein